MGEKVLSEELEDVIFEFLESERSCSCAVSKRLLEEEALIIASNLKLGNLRAVHQMLEEEVWCPDASHSK